ncbi:PAS domain-containing protein [Dactylosporangium matsuzakiense]|uniref:Chemotaxis protein n=1 Tax=Dactylosporangium matsuzakiense TaxID=53360 RepID=A0A9W6KLL4_9ACTN|nr:PAS domain-containing protein [Dactylosporangium matsuzakiense]GLL02794.1 chemotaxis protein [Dactylosporangium matsuzakiense]
MRSAAVMPSGQVRTFGLDEVIVTKTDLQGRISYANDVFLRVSALGEHDALGKPHNIVRHPDMPRCVFKLLWDSLGAGTEIFAYVLNLAADGAEYWVLAHVTPSRDASGRVCGYHSNRRVPAPAALQRIRPLYEELRATEQGEHSADAGLAASAAALDRAADGDYDAFVWSLSSDRAA